MADVENTQQETTQETTEQNANLSIADLATIKNILDLATARGAFKGSELEAVGKAYNKLNTFLEEIAKQQSQAEATAGSEEA